MGKFLLILVTTILCCAQVILWRDPQGMLSTYVSSLTSLLPQLTIITAYIALYMSGISRYSFIRNSLYLLGWVLPSYVVYALLSPTNVIHLPALQPLDIFVLIELSIISFLLTRELPVKQASTYYALTNHSEKDLMPTPRFREASRAS